nr:hypothetical protein [Nitrospira sp.]
ECALVVGLNHEDRLRPRIRIIRGTDGKDQKDPIEVDLQNQAPDQPTRSIIRALDPNQEHVDLPQYLETAVGGPS